MKLNPIWLFAVIAAVISSSCVSNKRYVYLQKDDVKKTPEMLDTVVRVYDIQETLYRIQPNDALYISFESLTNEKFDFLSEQSGAQTGTGQMVVLGSELVNMAGFIELPGLGPVKLAGLTIFEAQDTLQALADVYLESPVVKVRLSNFRFTVLGEVTTEGTVSTFNNRISIPEALGLAGGTDDLADKSKIKLIRQVNSRAEVVYINLLDENFVHSPYFYVHPSDVLIVPPLKQRPYRKYFGQNFSVLLSAVSVVLLVVNLTK